MDTSTPLTPPPLTPSPHTPAPPRRAHAGWWVLVGLVVLIALLIGGAAGALGWTLRSEAGTAWLLARAPGLTAEGVRGPLLGDFEATQVTVTLPGGTDHVTLKDLGWRGPRLQSGAAGTWLRVTLDELHASRIDVVMAPGKRTEPLTEPADLVLPVEVELRALSVGEIHASALGEQPLRDLKARLHVGALGGTEHRVDQLSVAWDKLRASASGRIDARAPMALTATVDLAQQAVEPAASQAWNAHATLNGPLATPLLQATLRARPAPERPAQSLDARATLRPFAAWPLGDLQATARALDLSAFGAGLPATALDLEASAASTGLDRPAIVSLRLVNGEAGRWNEARLPLRALVLQLQARPDDPSTLDLQTFEADLGTKQHPAGTITGAGRYTPTRWTLDATLKALQPALLDARASAMQLGGPVRLVGTGFDGATLDTATIDAKAELTGQLTALLGDRRAARNVGLRLDALLNPRRVELREARLSAGGALATLSGTVTRAAAEAPWQVKGRTTLVDFDPTPWWPGRGDSPWRQGPHKLNASGDFELAVPANIATRPLREMLTAPRGRLNLSITRGLLAGVPLTGEIALRSTDGAQALPVVKLDAAGNTINLQGRLATTGTGAGDSWDVKLDAPSLERLAPLFKLLQAAGADTTLAGSLTASAKATGRWPDMQSQGTLDANALRIGPASLAKARARWQLGSRLNAAVDAELSIAQASLGPAAPSLESLVLTLKGTGRAHALEARAESKALPPAWTDAFQPGAAPAAAGVSVTSTTPPRTVAVVRAQGGLTELPGAPAAGWRGTLQQVDARSNAPQAPALASTRDVGIELQWAGGPARATVQPGRAEVLGAALRWSEIAWQAAGADAKGAATPARIDAQAELEPFPVAPLLARLQPSFGWGGDLAITGHVKLRSAPTFSADVVLERSGGDLSVTDETGKQSLGLSDLRLALNAANGTWNFTQALAGTTLGTAAGAVVAHTSPQALWPTADAPLQGVFDLRVANLGTWGTWVPAGWRLEGTLGASATLGGRFGAPEYTGQVTGTRLGVRNFVQGVNVTDGDVAIALQATTARIQRFSAKAGGGTVRLEGEASLGEAPRADLKLTADRFQLLGRVDRRIVTSGNARLQLDRDSLALDGQFGVDEGLIDFTRSDAPTLGDDVVVVRGTEPPAPTAADPATSAAAANAPPPTRKVALNLNVNLGQKLRVRGRGLDTGLRGELHITSPGGRMAVNGTVSTADGTYQAYGQKLVIDRGLITFSGSTDNPRLDIEATRPNLDTRVGVQVSGTTANPRVRLFSEPELSEIDKLSYLVMGRASDGLGRTDTALLQRAAVALLSGEGPGLTDQFIKSIGLDELSFKQSDGEVKETVISLGKQISRRWYVGYERGLNTTTGSFQLIYRIAQRFTLRAQSGADNSVDVIWTWRWQ